MKKADCADRLRLPDETRTPTLRRQLSLEMMVNSLGQVALRPISLSQCLQFDISCEVERNRDNLAFHLQRVVSELTAEIRGRVTPGCPDPMSSVGLVEATFVPRRDPASCDRWGGRSGPCS